MLLASGCTFCGSLILKNIHGNFEMPVLISTYPCGSESNNQRTLIDASGYSNGILLEDCSGIEIGNLTIKANAGGLKVGRLQKKNMRCGVLVKTTKAGIYQHIYLNKLLVKDVFYESKGFSRGAKEVKTSNGSQSYGWGIRFISTVKGATLKDPKVNSCVVRNVSHTGIKFTGRPNGYGIQNIQVQNNRVTETGGPGIQMSGVANGKVSNNYINGSGSNNDTRKWGRGSGLWTWGTRDVLVEKNYFLNANGPGDSAGAHIDFNCNNVVLQYNFSANNAGGFCEILGNNYNCAYRYNISVNDGYRVKGEDGAFQEGKIIWFSGYRGKKKARKGPFNSYVYNNTIYTNQDIVAKIAVDKAASGILMVNNIFYLEGKSKVVMGDQYNPEKAGASRVQNLVFRNNLFINGKSWPKDAPIRDSQTIIGDPEFEKRGGMQIKDYIPTNKKLIIDKGIEITNIPNDSTGLTIGLLVQFDILGNRVCGRPDLGAIEFKK